MDELYQVLAKDLNGNDYFGEFNNYQEALEFCNGYYANRNEYKLILLGRVIGDEERYQRHEFVLEWEREE